MYRALQAHAGAKPGTEVVTITERARYPVAAAFAYESVAICSNGRLPTISAFCGSRPWLSPAVLAGLALHLRLTSRALRPGPARTSAQAPSRSARR